MLIDIHTHTCRMRPLTKALGRHFVEPAALIEMMDARGIDRAILLPIVSPEHQTHYLTPEEVMEVCEQYPDRLVPFCCLDPRMVGHAPESDFRPILRFYKEAGFKGFGEHIASLPFDHPMQLNLFRQVEEVGLPLTFHIAPRQGGFYGCVDDLGLPRLEKMLKACPNLRVLGHSQPFWAEIGADVTDETRNGYPKGKVRPGRTVELMRRYPNLYGDLSAGSGFNAISRDPEFGYAFLEEFQDRLLFGTDICWPGQETPIVAYFERLRNERLISPEACEKIAWRNADRLLGLGIQERKP